MNHFEKKWKIWNYLTIYCLKRLPNKCFVTGCKRGYESNKGAEAQLAEQGDPISIFLFPEKDTIRKEW